MIYYKGFNNKNIYLASLALLVIGLPLSNLFMSIAQFSLIINWVLGLDFKRKFSVIKQNSSLLVILFVFVLHLIGLSYSSNISYGIKDIVVKIPLFLIPLVIASSEPLSKKEFKAILFLFCITVVVSTFLNIGYYFEVFKDKAVDKKHFSHYISHIRYALLICMAIFILFNYSFRKKELTGNWFTLAVISLFWLIVFLFILKSLTGILLFFICALAVVTYFILIKKALIANRWFIFPALTLFCVMGLFSYNVISNYYVTKPFEWKNLDAKTINGNDYEHYWLGNQRENGNYVGVYVCWTELEKEWTKKSSQNYWATDNLQQPLRFTLIRYLASKGLRKDSIGLNLLSADDIKKIESGKTNYLPKRGLSGRIEEVLFEFDNYLSGGNPGGHSISQRVEYWKIAWYIISDNFWFGVGTGDVNDAFQKAYNETNSPLDQQWRLRSHNQYLSIFVAFGAFGFGFFIFSLIFPLIALKKNTTFNYVLFLAIICLSFLTEDTLESQPGATFFAFFNSFLLFAYRKEEKK